MGMSYISREGRGGSQEQFPVRLQRSRVPDPTCTLLPALLVFYWTDFGQNFFNPEVCTGSNYVMVLFVEESIVGDSVESLRKI